MKSKNSPKKQWSYSNCFRKLTQSGEFGDLKFISEEHETASTFLKFFQKNS